MNAKIRLAKLSQQKSDIEKKIAQEEENLRIEERIISWGFERVLAKDLMDLDAVKMVKNNTVSHWIVKRSSPEYMTLEECDCAKTLLISADTEVLRKI